MNHNEIVVGLIVAGAQVMLVECLLPKDRKQQADTCAHRDGKYCVEHVVLSHDSEDGCDEVVFVEDGGLAVAVVVEVLHLCKQFLHTTWDTTHKSTCLDVDPLLGDTTLLEVQLCGLSSVPCYASAVIALRLIGKHELSCSHPRWVASAGLGFAPSLPLRRISCGRSPR